MNNNHTSKGYVLGSSDEMPVELVLLHAKKLGVLEK